MVATLSKFSSKLLDCFAQMSLNSTSFTTHIPSQSELLN